MIIYAHHPFKKGKSAGAAGTSGSIAYMNAEQAGQFEGLQRRDDRSFQFAGRHAAHPDSGNLASGEIDSLKRRAVKFGFRQIASPELRLDQLAAIERRPPHQAIQKNDMAEFAFRQIHIFSPASPENNLVEDGFGKIGTCQFAIGKLHPVETAAGKPDVGKVAMGKKYVAELGFVKPAPAEGRMLNAAIADG